MAKKLISGQDYPRVNEDGTILIKEGDRVLKESDKGISNGIAPLNTEGKVPTENLPPGGGAAWGGITGTLSAQTDLGTALGNKSDTGHNHALNNLSEKSYNNLTDKPTIPSAIDDLTDVIITSPTSAQVISYNGANFVNVDPGSVSAGKGVIYYLVDTDSDIGGYKSFLTAPSASGETSYNITVNSGEGDKLIKAFASDSGFPGTTLWSAGLWECMPYASVDSATGVTEIKMKVYKRAVGGAETLLFDCPCGEVNSVTAELLGCVQSQPDFVVDATDRLIIKYYAATDSGANRTVYLYLQGTFNVSRVHTPLAVFHNQLPGLQGGTANQYYHLTSAELSKLGGIAAGAEVNINADWNAGSGDAQILNKPSIPSQYTDELAQDAVGTMLDSQSLVYTDLTPLLEVKMQMSVTKDASGLKLSADATSPGNNKAYGTDAGGVKGWRDFPAAGAHDLGGTSHNADTLANLNLKVSDADVVALAGQIGGTAASPDIRGLRESGGQLLTMGAVTDSQYLLRSGTTIISGSPGGGSPPAWKGNIAACWKDGDPHWIIDSLLHNPIHATPTNISVTVARCAFFKLDTALVVNKIRWFGVGATTGVYRVALYRLSDLVRLAILNDFNTAAQAWGNGAFSVSLSAGIIYFIAVAIDTVGTTAGVACHSATTGRIGILPTDWPGNLDINAASPKIDAMGFCQFAVTAGALPTPAGTLLVQAAWTGGMPAFFLDNNNA